MPPRLRLLRPTAGFTIVESAAAMGLVGTFIAILLAMSSNIIGLIQTAKNNIAASQTLQERVELVRGVNWLQLTNGSFVASNILGSDSDSTAGLADATEIITVSAYPSVSGVGPVKVIREDGVTSILADNPTLRAQRVVRVDVELRWRGAPRNRLHTRATATIVSRSGNK